mgnify:CR=1 FL=1
MWCGIYVTDHWTEWTQSYSGFFNHELEAVFSAVFGWLILGQKLSTKEILGCCLIFSAIILARLPVQRKAKFAGESHGENRNE